MGRLCDHFKTWNSRPTWKDISKPLERVMRPGVYGPKNKGDFEIALRLCSQILYPERTQIEIENRRGT